MAGAQVVALPMAESQAEALPMAEAQVEALPMAGAQVEALPMTGAQEEALRMAGAQVEALPIAGASPDSKSRSDKPSRTRSKTFSSVAPAWFRLCDAPPGCTRGRFCGLAATHSCIYFSKSINWQDDDAEKLEPVTSHRSRVTGHGSQVTGHR